MDIEERKARVINRLRAGANVYACGEYLAELTPLHRSEIMNNATYDRLERKYNAVNEIHTEADENWNQTFYLMFFRTLGDKKNQSAYLTLARRVTYAMVLRERASLHNIEAMLFGCSGLLELYKHDTYTLDLRRDFEYLAAKYDIKPMEANEWNLTKIQPANHPVLRLAQAAVFLSSNEFVMDRIVRCETSADVMQLFGVEASQYWSTHYIPGSNSCECSKRIGYLKSTIIGINLVVIMQYAYGSYIDSELLRDRAVTLLERLDAEDNIYIRHWRESGVTPRNAFESQGLLQLATEYCPAKRCEECPVGRRRISAITQ